MVSVPLVLQQRLSGISELFDVAFYETLILIISLNKS